MHGTEHTAGAIHYWTYHDDKRPVIFVIHGFRGTHHGLEKIIAELPEYRFIVPDLPGFGDTPAFPDRPHTIENYARAVEELIDSLKLTNLIILGHSMGTIIAADIARHRPALVAKLLLINPVSETPPKLKLLPGYLYHYIAGKYTPERLGDKILRNKWLFLIGSATMTKTRDKALRKEIHWNHITYMKQFDSRKSLMEAFAASNSSSVGHYADAIMVPTLMIVGRNDDIAPLAGQQRVAARLTQATLVILDHVGHIIHYEQPREAAAAIRTFLSS